MSSYGSFSKIPYAPFLKYAKGLFALRKTIGGPTDGSVQFTRGEFDAMLDAKNTSVDLTFVRAKQSTLSKWEAKDNAVLKLAMARSEADAEQQTNDFYAAVLLIASEWSWHDQVLMTDAMFMRGFTNCLLHAHNDTMIRVAERDLSVELNTKYIPFLSAKQRELFGIVSKQ